MTKLDNYHFHEALHTAHLMAEFIDSGIVQHHVFENAPDEIKMKIFLAQKLLGEYYQYCGEQQDKLIEEEVND